MAEQVGLARYFNIEWLNLAAYCKVNGKTLKESKDILDETIALKIQSKDNIRKARSIVQNLWYKNDSDIMEQCVKTYIGTDNDGQLALHWALLLSYYPVFYDLTSVMGELLSYSDTVQIQQINKRIYEIWGARNTLKHSLCKNMQTLKDMNVLLPGEKKGDYKPIKHIIDNRDVVAILVQAYLKSSGKAYATWNSIMNQPTLFPFEIRHVTQADMAACEYLALERMGDEVVIRRKQ